MINITVTGRVGKDAEVRAAGNSQVVSFSLASNKRIKEGGQWVKGTEWLDVSFFGERAVKVADFIKKGGVVEVRGELTTRVYRAKDGTDKTVLDVRADNVELHGGKSDSAGATNGAKHTTKAADDFGSDDFPDAF
jgi:single-strand DNA-binding protein